MVLISVPCRPSSRLNRISATSTKVLFTKPQMENALAHLPAFKVRRSQPTFYQISILTLFEGGITAAMPGGSWLGALISGYLSDNFGRKKAIQIGCIIWCIGSIVVCASQNIGMLIVGRVINGLAVGICSAQVPVYISELAPPSKRGRLVGCQQCKTSLRKMQNSLDTDKV